ncbi:MAG: DNA double-strand break repair nuclease NurA [Cyanobacteriota bacterium]|nr:DNA double-strand break repair nuclease NurA [Cyanobacteriota bacterium]
MLDLIKLTAQVSALGQHLQQESLANQQRLQKAMAAFEQASRDPYRWQERWQTWQNHLAFTVASPQEAIEWVESIPMPVAQHTVVATDGSQIVPSHHEVAYCSLINVGRVVLPYGNGRWPLLDSLPLLFYRSGDLGQSRGIGVEDLLALRRTQAEMEELTQLALAAQGAAPLLALVDGSLIHWGLDDLSPTQQKEWLAPLLHSYDQLRAAGIPVAGYVSASRSSEVVNYLRVGLCPYLGCDCQHYCAEAARYPCHPFAPLSDRVFWASRLSPGQRSSLWQSGAKLLELYGDHRIICCYLHVGSEIARVEVPQWVARDPDLLSQALGMILSQVQKGLGYPVALAEAHHLAVVRGGDRQRFFALVEQELRRSGLTEIAVSRKEARKRQGIA